MKLLLKEDVENLGFYGDEVVVKDGYGRNYLIPAGKAILATPKNKKLFSHQKGIIQARLNKLKGSALQFAEQIEKVSCVFTRKLGEQGKLFGSVTTMEIAEFLKSQGVKIDRRKIQRQEPIKSLGEFKVPLRLHPEVTAQINVTVVKEETKEKEKAEVKKEEGKKGPKKKTTGKKASKETVPKRTVAKKTETKETVAKKTESKPTETKKTEAKKKETKPKEAKKKDA